MEPQNSETKSNPETQTDKKTTLSKPLTQVIHTKGDDYEIGSQHALKTRAGLEEGMLLFYSRLWKSLSGIEQDNFFSTLAFSFIQKMMNSTLVPRLISSLPADFKQRLTGLSEHVSFEKDELFTIAILPDLFPWLEAYLAKWKPSDFTDVVIPPRWGCSSFVAKTNHHFLHGRNFDFPGVGYWDRYQVIQLFQKSNSLKYIGFTTAGVPLAGITGINEAQISVSLHQHYCVSTAYRGVLPFVVGEKLLQHATSLREAIEIIKKHKLANAWAFVLTDGKTKEACVYECHPTAAGVRFLNTHNPFLTHSNHFQTNECKPQEYAATSRMNWDNYARSSRLKVLLEKNAHVLDYQKAASIISDHFDPYWGEEKIINRTVSQVYNIQSLVIDSTEMKALVAEGNAPVHLGKYVEYDLGEIFSEKQGLTGKIFSGFQFKDSNKREAKTQYISSFIDAMDGDWKGADEKLQKCLKHQGLKKDACAEAAITAGAVRLKLDDYSGAQDLFETACQIITEKKKLLKENTSPLPPEYFEARLFLARTYDLKGFRSKALRTYQSISEHLDLEDQHLLRIALKEGPYRPKQTKKIYTPYSSYIPFQ